MANATSIASRETSDTLLASLVIMTEHHHRPFSAAALTAGLPLVDGCLTPDLFIRAANRAGFAARLADRDLESIPEEVLPAVLLLEGGEACVLTASDHAGDAVGVIFPESGDDPVSVPRSELTRIYAGQVIYVKPTYEFGDGTAADSTQSHWFWSTIRISRGIYGEVLVASLLVNLFALVSPLFIMNVYDRVVPNQAIETLWVLASGVAIVLLFDLVMKGLRGYFVDVASKRADILLSSRTFAQVLDIQMFARPGSVGSFANNLQEFDGFREFFTSTTLIALIDLPFVVLFVIIIYSVGGPIAWVPVAAVPLIVTVGLIVQRPLQAVVSQSFTESARKHALLVETLAGLDTIKGARAEGVMQKRWEEHNARLARLGLRSRLLAQSTINFAGLVQQLATVLVVITGVYLITAGDISVGALIACTILTGRCLAPMAQVATILTRLYHSLAAYQSIDRIMQLPVERPKGRTFLHRPAIEGGIRFREVGFAYPGSSIPALQNINFTIQPRERVAIIGRLGSGKSTLHRLILGFYPADSGSVLIDGTDINQLDPTDLRSCIGYVPQDVTLFAGSVRDNIVLGAPQSTDDKVLAAAQTACLNEFLSQHPEGYDLEVGERGANLSGGQRQAIAIARALLTSPSLLLLDEPTSAMDNTTESQIRARLEAYIQNRTMILVTHKSSMLSLVDRLLVVNAGRIVADGPKNEVLEALAGGQS